ncbi:MAG TPA: EpsG family protein [Ferruginibacter sp.]|nr:EpsG family protein [Ferruginibacter sp.]
MIAVEYEIKPFKSNGLLGFIILSFALLAGLRSPDVARDYQQYQFAFDTIYDFVKDESGAYFSVFEPGFVLIVLLFRVFFVYNYGVAIMLFYAIISVTAKVSIFNRYSLNPYLVILLYFSHYFIIQEMTQIRIGFASALFLVSLIFYFKNNYGTYIAIILFASLFHYSAIFYLLLLFFDKTSFNRTFYLVILLISVLLAFLKLPIFGFLGNLLSSGNSFGKINTYSDVIQNNLVDEINVFNLINLAKIACSIYLIFLSGIILRNDKHLLFFLKCNILSIFTLSLFSGVPLIAFRFSELFGIISVFNFAYLAKYLPFSKYNIWIIILLACLFFYLNVIVGGLLNPYKVIGIQ